MTHKTAGDVFIERLAAHGVDYLFANGGTDFAPIIEALARRQSEGETAPQALPIPHETVALGMAHGYTLVTGRPQAVMVHTNVGLANIVMGAINAATEQIPILICSGATPLTETGRLGSRTTPINWGQDMKDQSALVRESVKWNTTLNYAEQMGALVDRALAIAMSAPTGPVYLSLPREPLCQTVDAKAAPADVPLAPAAMAPHPYAIAEAARILSQAQRPLIVAHRIESGADPRALQDFAEEFALPVVEYWPSRISLDSESPMHAGFNSGPDVAEADAILVLNALTPWIPVKQGPSPGCRVIQAGPDPLHARFPIRGFRSDVSLAGDTASILAVLGAALRAQWAGGRRPAALDARFKILADRNAARREQRLARARTAGAGPMSMEYVSYCVSQALGADGVIVNELGVDAGSVSRSWPGSLYSHAVSGGLGWGLTAALGVQLALPGKIVAACVGDGSYMFANPVACHQVAEALNLNLLTVVMNNGVWNAVRRSTLEIFPDGHASRANLMPVTTLEPAPDYCMIARASRAWAETVEDAAELPGALQRALHAIRTEKRQALLNVRTGTGAGEGR